MIYIIHDNFDISAKKVLKVLKRITQQLNNSKIQ